MNVTELARRLKMTTKELLELLPELGFDIGRRAIKIDSRLVDKIISAVESHRKKQRLAQAEKKVKEIKLHDDEQQSDREPSEKVIKIPEIIIVKDLAEKMGLPVTKVIAELMKNGVMSSLNERIDFTTASIIGEDLGFKVEHMSEEESQSLAEATTHQKLKDILAQNKTDHLIDRAPVVVVMGHVDHGKTKLLDAIRKTNIIDQEAGGITQHIGAYQVIKQDKLITFLDTPGHEAFKSMRSRGSKIADVAIIVVAADDGLKPQTLEVIDLIQKENIPFVVAINKIDKEGADVDRVKKELSEINLIPEDWGGKVVCASISAKEGKGIEDLLDMVLLVADLEELKSDATVPAVGTIIEAHVDKSTGPLATVLVQAGTLKIGDLVIVGQVTGKIRVLQDWSGQEVSEAGPSMPVKIIGLKETPQVGDILEVTEDKKKIKELSKRSGYKKEERVAGVKSQAASESADDSAEALNLNLVLKSDVLGSQEAILEALAHYDDPEVKLNVIKKGLGNVTDADVLDAQSAGGLVVAFHVKNLPSAEELARDKGVKILYFEIIYKLLEDIEARLKQLLKPEVIRTQLGKMQVLAIFKTEKKAQIVGGKILEGKVRSATKVKVLRGGEVIAIGDLTELRSGKEIVDEMVEGGEAGLKFVGEPIIAENDTLEIYQEETKERAIKKT